MQDSLEIITNFVHIFLQKHMKDNKFCKTLFLTFKNGYCQNIQVAIYTYKLANMLHAKSICLICYYTCSS